MSALVSKTIVLGPADPLDLDVALVDAAFRADIEQRELAMLDDPITGTLMEYALLAEVA